MTSVELETIRAQEWRKELEKVESAPNYEWGGGAPQFVPIFRKALEHYEQVVIPAWCFS